MGGELERVRFKRIFVLVGRKRPPNGVNVKCESARRFRARLFFGAGDGEGGGE